jgi:hypothetical protein
MKSAAILTIHNAADMTAKGKKDIAKWIDRQKEILLKNNKELSGRYTARYLYNSTKSPT